LILDWAIIGGFLAGAVAGAAARFGRLCTMSAIEDALVGGDRRGMKAWGLAIASAIAATHTLTLLGWIDLDRSLYTGTQFHALGAILGGGIFGLGMTLVGTCSFGLIVRAGGGDLRALMSALVVGIFAFAATAGALAPLRTPLLALGIIDLSALGGVSLDRMIEHAFGANPARAFVPALVCVLVVIALADKRLRNRPRLITGSIAIGLSIALGWLVTSQAVNAMTLDRPESLSFVAPVGRALLQFMMEPFRNVGFGVAAMFGALVASYGVAHLRREVRWEAFDDALEMRRHLFGAMLMGLGGVLAQGCTVGQGLSAASTLSISAPLFLIGVLIGAKLGLRHLIEGHAVWRLGLPSRGYK
jgi:uncharacterized protein